MIENSERNQTMLRIFYCRFLCYQVCIRSTSCGALYARMLKGSKSHIPSSILCNQMWESMLRLLAQLPITSLTYIWFPSTYPTPSNTAPPKEKGKNNSPVKFDICNCIAGWCGEVRDVIFSDDGSVTVVYRVTIRGSDGEVGLHPCLTFSFQFWFHICGFLRILLKAS